MQEMEGEGEKNFLKEKIYMYIVHTCINAFLQNVAFFLSQVVIVKNNIILSYVQSLSLCKK